MISQIDKGPIGRSQRRLVKSLEYVGAVILGGIMVLTIIDVVARYLFQNPIAASFEVTEIAMQIMVYLCLAVAVASNDHIRVTLIDAALARKPRLARWIDKISGLSIALVLFGMGLAATHLAAGKGGEMTAVLGLPIAPVAWVISLALFLSGALALYSVITNNTQGKSE